MTGWQTFAQFTNVIIDGDELTADSYEVAAGSLKIKEEYLKTPDAGLIQLKSSLLAVVPIWKLMSMQVRRLTYAGFKEYKVYYND